MAKRVNKSEEIRKALRKDADASPKALAEKLSKRLRVTVTAAAVSQQKLKLSKNGIAASTAPRKGTLYAAAGRLHATYDSALFGAVLALVTDYDVDGVHEILTDVGTVVDQHGANEVAAAIDIVKQVEDGLNDL